MNAEIVTCENVDPKIVHETVLAAFSDYSVPMQPSFEQFSIMLEMRQFDPTLSTIAIADGKVEAIWLVGRKGQLGHLAMSGTRPASRGKGIATALAKHAEQLQQKAGLSEFIFEVITSNKGAISLYEKLGYSARRKLDCYELELKSKNPNDPNIISDTQWPDVAKQAQALRDWQPSWQNANEAIVAAKDNLICLSYVQANKLIGYLVAGRKSGTIVQLAVHPEHRRNDIASRLLAELGSTMEQPKFRFINIDADCAASKAFLTALGAQITIQQFEMHKDLRV